MIKLQTSTLSICLKRWWCCACVLPQTVFPDTYDTQLFGLEFAALPEETSSVPSFHSSQSTTAYNPSSRDSGTIFGLHGNPNSGGRHINIGTDTKNKFKNSSFSLSAPATSWVGNGGRTAPALVPFLLLETTWGGRVAFRSQFRCPSL